MKHVMHCPNLDLTLKIMNIGYKLTHNRRYTHVKTSAKLSIEDVQAYQVE